MDGVVATVVEATGEELVAEAAVPVSSRETTVNVITKAVTATINKVQLNIY